jgi:hypothetical protein
MVHGEFQCTFYDVLFQNIGTDMFIFRDDRAMNNTDRFQ